MVLFIIENVSVACRNPSQDSDNWVSTICLRYKIFFFKLFRFSNIIFDIFIFTRFAPNCRYENLDMPFERISDPGGRSFVRPVYPPRSAIFLPFH